MSKKVTALCRAGYYPLRQLHPVATVKLHGQGNTAAVKPQRMQPDKSVAQAAPGDQRVSVYKVALDSVVDRDRSVGLVASGASGVIEHQSVDRVCRGKSVDEHMNEFVDLQSFDVTNHGDNDESFDIVTMFNDCLPPVNEDVRCDNVQQVSNISLQFDMEKVIADSDVSMHFVDLCVFDESGNSVLLKTLFDSGTQLSILKEDLISHLDYEVLGEVKLQGFNGNISSGKIILLNAKLVGHNVYVPLRCVVCQTFHRTVCYPLRIIASYCHVKRYDQLG